jgi:hypothetical protein
MSTHNASSGRLRIGLHVKGLHTRWITVDRHRPVEMLRQNRFVGPAKVAAPFERLSLVVENADGLVVRDAGEGRFDVLELRGVALERLELALPLCRAPVR